MGASFGCVRSQPVEDENTDADAPLENTSDSKYEKIDMHAGLRELILEGCKDANVDDVQNLFNSGFNQTREFFTECLYTTSNHGHNSPADRLRLARWLLDRGADPDGCTTAEDLSPLSPACMTGHLELARLLLDRGANTNSGEGMRYGPPLICALRCYHAREGSQYNALVCLLLHRGADVHLKDSDNRTSLHHACRSDFVTPEMYVVRMLLEHGAGSDIYKKDCRVPMMGPHMQSGPFDRGYYPAGYWRGKTPLEYALEGDLRVKILLRKYFAIVVRKYVIGPPTEHSHRRIEQLAPHVASFIILRKTTKPGSKIRSYRNNRSLQVPIVLDLHSLVVRRVRGEGLGAGAPLLVL